MAEKRKPLVVAHEWGDDQWARFFEAARAQAAIDDAMAAAAWPDVEPQFMDLELQAQSRFKRSLVSVYNQARAVGRVKFHQDALAAAAKSATAAAWVGEKLIGIEGGTSGGEPVTIIVDV